MQGRWVILAMLSLAFFFVTATTFTSLAVVLFTMCVQLHWSMAEAGLSFSLLGLACGLSSPLPALAIRRIGARWTATSGGLLMAGGFLIAALSHGLAEFFVAVVLMGIAFSLVAPVPGMFLLPRWFPDHPARMVGFYFMGGSAGGVLGPLLVNASVSWTHDWRLHWAAMAALSLCVALLCFVCLRDRSESAVLADAASAHALPVPAWTAREAMATAPFLVTAFAMVVVQTALTVVNSSFVAHMHLLGVSQSYGASGIALVALTGTLAKGVAGALTERVHPLAMLVASLLLAAIAFALFGLSRSVAVNLAAAALFGVGWGTSWLGAHLLLLRQFGRSVTPALVGAATAITTLAVVGPYAAGVVADRTGSFSGIFLAIGALFLLALIPTLLLQRRVGVDLRLGVAPDVLPAAR